MKNILLLCAVLLTGCATTVPVPHPFPAAPNLLMEKCSKLETIDKETTSLSELLTTVTKNYTKYHTCSNLVDAWQERYTKHKKIYDDLNDD